jgi:hypothetical protein
VTVEASRQTFVVHVLAGGSHVLVEDVATRERAQVDDLRHVGDHIAERVRPFDAETPEHRHRGES